MTRLFVVARTRLTARDGGATAVEYALLIALIACVIAVAVVVLGQSVSTAFQSAAQAL